MRRKHEMVDNEPVSCWDNGPKFADRYTVVYLSSEVDGRVQYLSMSERPFHPQGFGQHGEMPVYLMTYLGRGGVFKKRIKFTDLPEDCQKAVHNDLNNK